MREGHRGSHVNLGESLPGSTGRHMRKECFGGKEHFSHFSVSRAGWLPVGWGQTVPPNAVTPWSCPAVALGMVALLHPHQLPGEDERETSPCSCIFWALLKTEHHV